ncbi:MAG: type II CRISPR RNA-guided endonuclease Cas9 [Candidatus Muirbacterium halophilum]|nr:type II CRISPR RNA-guided endonuclease Cas9 [Candidatus Muirbacterium halophilum]MCK9477656.1 type II CRISPR RNA-guided endonuclease Cas9 [Candidatus Muirbacterium halophilum]
MKVKIIGFDIGITSIGWSFIEIGDKKSENKIIDAGVRIFNKAENPKTGESLAKPRRDNRLLRRRLKRRCKRISLVKKLCIKNKLITEEEIDNLFLLKNTDVDVWDLRRKALYEKLTKEEITRIFVHIIKNRGFNLKTRDDGDSETGKLKTAIANQIKILKSENFQTYGEMISIKFPLGIARRNKLGNYNKCVSRQVLEQELITIINKQNKFGYIQFNESFKKEILDIFNWQKESLSEEDLKKMVGKCLFEKEEFRAPKNSYSAEIFRALQTLNNLKILTKDGLEIRFNKEQIKHIMDISHTIQKINLNKIKKELFGDVEVEIKGLNSKKDNPEVVHLKSYHGIRKAFQSQEQLKEFEKIVLAKNLDNIIYILTYNKNNEEAFIKLKSLLGNLVKDETINELLKIYNSKFLHLSLKALNKLIPEMIEGLNYSEACAKLQYDFNLNLKNQKKVCKMPPIDIEIGSPVVKRALSEFRKVINALIKKHGIVHQINIEFARDINRNFEDRKKIEKNNSENHKKNEMAKNQCLEYGLNANGKNILKLRLYKEQDCKCLYSGKIIDIKRLDENGYAEIDHIIPYSRSMDDSYNNKVLCLNSENQKKSGKTPYEYFGQDKEKWENFICLVNYNKNMSRRKKHLLAKKIFDKRAEKDFKERNLNDTRYISRLVKSYCENFMLFEDSYIKNKVQVRNGQLTAALRRYWGVNSLKDRSNHYHHAIDSIVVAFATQDMVKEFATTYGIIENHKKIKYRAPLDNFREDIKKVIYNIFVSKSPRRKVTGAAHAETIKGWDSNKNVSLKRVSLENVKLETLEKLHNKKYSQNLYDVLKTRLEENSNEPKKAFSEPIFMKCNDEGKQGPEIKKITIEENTNSFVKVMGGIADNGEMIRIDVFKKSSKFFCVPIYVADILSKELPNLAVKVKNLKKNWDIIDNTYQFCFSLFKGDLIKVKQKNKTELIGYFNGMDISSAKILFTQDFEASGVKIGVGSKTLEIFEKHQVDILGNYFKVNKEKRMPFKKGM